jgi:hypothetical protein
MRFAILLLVLCGGFSVQAKRFRVICGKDETVINSQIDPYIANPVAVSAPSVGMSAAAPGLASGSSSFSGDRTSKVESKQLICVTAQFPDQQ